MGRPTKAQISLEALTHNWSLFNNQKDAQSFIIPVLKANAYGHGAVPLALHLQQNAGIKSCAVALIEEAIELRNAGFQQEIFLLGPFLKTQIKELIEFKITPFICNKNGLQNLVTTSEHIHFPVPIHLKIDTGMNRLGVKEEELDEIISILELNKKIVHLEGLCSHFLNGENLGSPQGSSEEQFLLFSKLVQKFQSFKNLKIHMANSDGFLRNTDCHRLPTYYGSRIGLALYGYSSLDKGLALKLKPVMTLTSTIVHINQVKKGETVSYNGTWKAPVDSTIAVIPIGYADGYRRLLSNKGRVLVRGQIVNVVGTVCMDYFMIDVTQLNHQTKINLGEEVELWGPNINLKQLASSIETIPYELLTTLSSRVPRIYL